MSFSNKGAATLNSAASWTVNVGWYFQDGSGTTLANLGDRASTGYDSAWTGTLTGTSSWGATEGGSVSNTNGGIQGPLASVGTPHTYNSGEILIRCSLDEIAANNILFTGGTAFTNANAGSSRVQCTRADSTNDTIAFGIATGTATVNVPTITLAGGALASAKTIIIQWGATTTGLGTNGTGIRLFVEDVTQATGYQLSEILTSQALVIGAAKKMRLSQGPTDINYDYTLTTFEWLDTPQN